MPWGPGRLVYCRAEYPLAVKRLKSAIEQAEADGLLGDNIFGIGFFLPAQNPGRRRGLCLRRRNRAHRLHRRQAWANPGRGRPFPAQTGLWGKPTIINNVKTWSHIPPIMARGAEWYASIGTGNSKGTKVSALVGKINNAGLVEVPMGITLREMIYDIGGGIRRPEVQGRPDRRPLGRLHPGGAPGHPGGL